MRVRSSDDDNVGSTRCIELNLVGTGLSYNTADNLAVLPENNSSSVVTLANLLGYKLNQSYDMEHTDHSKDKKDDFPSPFTPRDVLTRFLDFEGLPRASTLIQLVPYITDIKQKEWLLQLTLKENRAEYKSKIENEGRTTFELLINELSSIKIPLEDLMHIIPHMQPRYYTISSSSSLHPDTVHITGKLSLLPIPCPLSSSLSFFSLSTLLSFFPLLPAPLSSHILIFHTNCVNYFHSLSSSF